MKIKWLDRALIAGPYLTLVLSEKEYYAACADFNVAKKDASNWLKTDQSDATCHVFKNASGEHACVVALRVRKKTKAAQISAILVHESVHIWQKFKESIGEDFPSIEFEAYAIQTISQRLMEAYAARAKKGKK